MKFFNVRVLLILSLLVVFGTVGVAWAKEASNPASVNLIVDQWKGHEFTFLALPTAKQTAGYEIYTVDQATQGFQGDRSVRLPYADHVGKQVTVTEVVPFAAGNNQQEYMVSMAVNETGEKLLGRTMRGQLEGLVLTDDLNNARQQFLGKTVYPKFRELSGMYDPNCNTIPSSVTTKIGGPVKVIDVYAGNQSQKPIWLIVSVNGEKAILPIAYSWTNISVQAWNQTAPWQEAMFDEDPRISLGGSNDLWKQIQKGNVEEGMTKDQVKLSWGKPLRMEENGSIWIYGNKKLTFHKNVLHFFETVAETPAA